MILSFQSKSKTFSVIKPSSARFPAMLMAFPETAITWALTARAANLSSLTGGTFSKSKVWSFELTAAADMSEMVTLYPLSRQIWTLLQFICQMFMSNGKYFKLWITYLCAKCCHIILGPLLDDGCQGRQLDIECPKKKPCPKKWNLINQILP